MSRLRRDKGPRSEEGSKALVLFPSKQVEGDTGSQPQNHASDCAPLEPIDAEGIMSLL